MKQKEFVLEWFFYQEQIIQSKKNAEKLLSQFLLKKIIIFMVGDRYRFNSSVLGKTAERSRPEIAQVMFKKNEDLATNDLREIYLKLEKNRKTRSRKST